MTKLSLSLAIFLIAIFLTITISMAENNESSSSMNLPASSVQNPVSVQQLDDDEEYDNETADFDDDDVDDNTSEPLVGSIDASPIESDDRLAYDNSAPINEYMTDLIYGPYLADSFGSRFSNDAYCRYYRNAPHHYQPSLWDYSDSFPGRLSPYPYPYYRRYPYYSPFSSYISHRLYGTSTYSYYSEAYRNFSPDYSPLRREYRLIQKSSGPVFRYDVQPTQRKGNRPQRVINIGPNTSAGE